ncbi:pyridoxal-dependent decarboxylase [Streptomyces sp. AK02-01A]|uniref:pyridoxal-dependent decarboxylase n=1 Tax=Streptomyces sp. AK02-01A TaxID=3028648 RepID=UPI0029A11EF9|nr:pyridoxal-dependent decarboxylase [Streptomyces sp. AK02-01A]MDX3852395.1 pyridoxal-dependent decarboxylase [Streptomyces sp. AK02-01A]
MTPQEFRQYGHATVDWIADYWERLESLPVAPDVEPGQVRSLLPARPPERGEPFESLLRDMDDIVVPGLLHWQHPRFFGYFPANTSGPAVLADLLSAGLGVQGMSWATGPACTEMEEHVLDWLVEILGLPDHFRSGSRGGGVIQDTASSALLVSLVAALQRAGKGAVRSDGVGARRYGIYVTAETHSSAVKAAVITGLGERTVRYVRTDPATLALDADHLRTLVLRDLADDITPLLAVATVGTTSTTAVDPVAAIGRVSREHGIWLHVDAAYAGVAAVCPELRWLNDGVAEYADSYCTNPHKWLLTNFDCDTFWVADRAWLTGALTILPEYLRNAPSESGLVTDYRNWQIPLGRRFRALKLWAVIRWYGVEGLRRHIREGVATAARLAEWIRADERFELTAPHPLSLVCFRLRTPPGTDADEAGRRLLDRVNASGTTFLTHSRIDGRITLRIATGGTFTRPHHVEQAWQCLVREADRLLASGLDQSHGRGAG